MSNIHATRIPWHAPCSLLAMRTGPRRALWIIGIVAAVVGCFTRPFYYTDVIEQFGAIGLGSLTVVILTGFFTGVGAPLPSISAFPSVSIGRSSPLRTGRVPSRTSEASGTLHIYPGRWIRQKYL